MPQKEKTIVEPLDIDEFELPIGYTDENGVLHKTIKIHPVDGEVEEEIAKKNVRNNGGKVITEYIYQITEKLGTMKKVNRDIIRNLYNADRDFILLMSYLVSFSEDGKIKWEDQCPHCGEVFNAEINIEDIDVYYMTEEESRFIDIELKNGIRANGTVYKKVRLKLPDGNIAEMLSPVIQENPAEAVTKMLANITHRIEGYDDWNYQTFRKMTKRDRDLISKEVANFLVGADLAPEVSCFSCGEKIRSRIPVGVLMGE